MKRLVFAALMVLSACDSSTDALTTNCRASADQRATFMPRLPNLPVKIVADRAFDRDQRGDLERAVGEWNRYGHELMNQDFFNVTYGQLPDAARAGDPCSISGQSSDTFFILKETDLNHWTSPKLIGLSELIPGATRRCQTPNSVTFQVMLINPMLIQSLQQQSVFLHELGHSIGLDHTCAPAGGTQKITSQFRACDGLSADHPYIAAVMYYALRVSASPGEFPETKEILRTNDMERTACLYPVAH